jgi:hypothetical protein
MCHPNEYSYFTQTPLCHSLEMENHALKKEKQQAKRGSAPLFAP